MLCFFPHFWFQCSSIILIEIKHGQPNFRATSVYSIIHFSPIPYIEVRLLGFVTGTNKNFMNEIGLTQHSATVVCMTMFYSFPYTCGTLSTSEILLACTFWHQNFATHDFWVLAICIHFAI